MKSISLILILLQLSPAYADSRRMDFIRVGVFKEGAIKNYPILRQEIKKKLENLDDTRIVVSQGDQRISESTYKDFQDGRRVSLLIRKLRKAPLLPSELDELHAIQAKWERLGKEGALLQESIFSEAYQYWKEGKKQNAEKLVARALRIHPEGAGDYYGEWSVTEEIDNRPLTFGLMIENKRAALVSSCEVSVASDVPLKKIYVNGFWLPVRGDFRFQTGKIYRVARGPEYEARLVSCLRQSKLTLQLPELKENREQDSAMLDPNGSYLFFQDVQNEAVVDLYSKPVGLEKNFIRWAWGDSQQLSISDAKIESLAGLRNSESLSLAATSLARPNPHPPIASLFEEGRVPWYEHWVFWTIAGAVAVGATTYLLTRSENGPSVQSNPSGIRISLE